MACQAPPILSQGGNSPASPSADNPSPRHSSKQAAEEQKAGRSKPARAKSSKQADAIQDSRGEHPASLSEEEPRKASHGEAPRFARARKGPGHREANAATGAAAELAGAAKPQDAATAAASQKPAAYFESVRAAHRSPSASGATEDRSVDPAAGAAGVAPGFGGGPLATRQQAITTGGPQAAQHGWHQLPISAAAEHGAERQGDAAAAPAEFKRRRGRRGAQDGGSAATPSRNPDTGLNGRSSSLAAGRPAAPAGDTGPARQERVGGAGMDGALAEVQSRLKHLGLPPDAAAASAPGPRPAVSRSSRAMKPASAEIRTGVDARPSPLPRAFQLSLAGLPGFSAKPGRVAQPGDRPQPQQPLACASSAMEFKSQEISWKSLAMQGVRMAGGSPTAGCNSATLHPVTLTRGEAT